jgi:hypothetical protein
LIWTFRPDGLVRLPQVAISPELLRTTLGTRLMRSLIPFRSSRKQILARLWIQADRGHCTSINPRAPDHRTYAAINRLCPNRSHPVDQRATVPNRKTSATHCAV